MNVCPSNYCFICGDGNPKTTSYKAELRFEPTANQIIEKIFKVYPKILHVQSPRKIRNPDTNKMEIAKDSITGKTLKGKIHWCCDDCKKIMERTSNLGYDTFKCPLCRFNIPRMSVKELKRIDECMQKKKFNSALTIIKRVYEYYPAMFSNNQVCLQLLNLLIACIQGYEGNKIIKYILNDLHMIEYESETNHASAFVELATEMENRSALNIMLRSILRVSIDINHMMYTILQTCLSSSKICPNEIMILLNKNANPIYSHSPSQVPNRPQFTTSFGIFIETARHLNKADEKLYKTIFRKMIENIYVDEHSKLVFHSSQHMINLANTNDSIVYNPFSWISNTVILNELKNEIRFFGDRKLFDIHMTIHDQNVLFDMRSFLQCDFDSEALPRLEFFRLSGVSMSTCPNGITPIMSLLNHVWHIEIGIDQETLKTQDVTSIVSHRIDRAENLVEYIRYFVRNNVDLEGTLTTDIDACDLITTLIFKFGIQYQILLDRLRCGRRGQGKILKRWPLSDEGLILTSFFAFENGKWDSKVSILLNIIQTHSTTAIFASASRYLGSLSPNTAIVYLETIIGATVKDSFDFEIELEKEVKAYDIYQMINDTRKGAKWTGEESPVYCGWHLILQKSLSQLHTANVSRHFNNAFSLLNINSEVLTRLQNMPVNKAKTFNPEYENCCRDTTSLFFCINKPTQNNAQRMC